MQVYAKRRDIESTVAYYKTQQKSIGFVPTMGALHSGHLALVRRAMDENDITIVSIFVNPTQFNNREDLLNYPRTIESDTRLLESISSKIIIFSPTAEEIYGDQLVTKSYNFGGIEHQMEGKFRPGHFDGVGTVLKHFFTIISPDRAYFGEKDFQQLQIVKKLIEIEKIAIEIIGCPIFREPSGLALSSRNKRLTADQLATAPFIYKTLGRVKEDFGIKSATELTNWVHEEFRNQKLFYLEYFEIATIQDLKTIIEKRENTKYRAFIAVFMGEVRLIDTIALN